MKNIRETTFSADLQRGTILTERNNLNISDAVPLICYSYEQLQKYLHGAKPNNKIDRRYKKQFQKEG